MKKILNNKKGFTFIETLVSVTILSFVIIGVLTMTTVHIKMNSSALHHTKAVQLAEEGVEMLLRLDSSLLPGYYAPGKTENFGTITKYPDFSRTITVKIDPGDMNKYTITSSVVWKSQKINSKPLVLSILRTL